MSALLQDSNRNVGEFNGTISTTITIDAAGNNRGVAIGCGLEFTGATGDVVSDITIDGTSILSNVIDESIAATFRVAFGYYALEADLPSAAGTYNVVITFTGGVHTNKEVEAIAVDYYTDVDQSAGLITNGVDSSSSNITSGGVALTPTSSDYLMVAFLLSGGTSAVTWNSPAGVVKTNEVFNAEGGISSASFLGSAGGSQTIGWTATAMRYGMIAGMFDSAAASGLTGSLNENSANDTVSASGVVGIQGSLNENSANDTISASGVVGSVGPGVISIVDVPTPVDSTSPVQIDFDVPSDGNYLALQGWQRDGTALLAITPATFDGNNYTELTDTRSEGGSEQAQTFFSYAAAMTTGTKVGSLTWAVDSATPRASLGLLFNSSSGNPLQIAHQGVLGSGTGTTISGNVPSQEGDVIILLSSINGSVPVTADSSEVEETSYTDASAEMQWFSKSAVVSPAVQTPVSLTGPGGERWSVSYVVVREDSAPVNLTGSVSISSQNDTLSASGIVGNPVTVTDVDTDEIIDEGQTNVAVTGTGFEAVQGTGSMTFGSVAQALGAGGWSDTLVHFNHAVDSTKYGSQLFRVTNDSGDSDTLAVVVNPPSGIGFVDPTSFDDSNITSIEGLVVGNQIRYGLETDTNGFLVNIDTDGIITIDKEGSMVSVDGDTVPVSAWDHVTETWGAYADQTLYEPIDGNVDITTSDDTLSSSGIVGIYGNVSITVNDDTLSASGVIAGTITGSVNITSSDDNLSATAEISLVANLTESSGDDTLSSSGILSLIGAVSQTVANDILNASGSVGGDISGIVDIASQDDVIVSSGVISNIGSVNESSNNDILTATSLIGLNITGVVNATSNDDTLSASGLVGDGIFGSVNITTENDTLAASGVVQIIIQGNVNASSNNDQVSAFGVVTIKGSVDETTNPDQLTGALIIGDGIIGSVDITTNPDTVFTEGYIGLRITGSLNITSQNDTLLATGFIGDSAQGVVIKSPVALTVELESLVDDNLLQV